MYSFGGLGMIGATPLLVRNRTDESMLNTLARASRKLSEVARFLARGGLIRLGRYEVYAGCGAMLPDQSPMIPRRCHETGSVVVRMGGRAVVVSPL